MPVVWFNKAVEETGLRCLRPVPGEIKGLMI